MCFLKSQCTFNTEGVGSAAAGGRHDTKVPTASFLQNVSGGIAIQVEFLLQVFSAHPFVEYCGSFPFSVTRLSQILVSYA